MSLYGALAGVAGDAIFSLIGHETVSFAAGMVLAALGVWFLLRNGRCSRIELRTPPFIVGVIDGLTPCGTTAGLLLYVAALGEGVWYGLLDGFLFGLGTGPALFALSLVGNFIGTGLRRRMSAFIPLFGVILGLLFILRGLNLGIPFISPTEQKIEQKLEMEKVLPEHSEDAAQGCCGS